MGVQAGGEPPETARLSRNERQILDVLRTEGASPKSTLARKLGLSPTAVGHMIGRLEADGLVLRGEPLRGRIGQPSVPYRVDPAGAYSVGVKIGRRSTEVVLLDAEISPVRIEERLHSYPDVADVFEFVESVRPALLSAAPATGPERFCGVGVAIPSEIWSWSDQIDAPEGALAAWGSIDVAARIEASFGASTSVVNDATAAAAADLALAARSDMSDYLTIFVGWFVGGGVVLDGRLHPGRRGGSGAIGSMPIGASDQLIRTASLAALERAWRAEGGDPDAMWASPDDWSALGDVLDAWLDRAAAGIARAVASAACVIDFEAAVIDGATPVDVRADLTRRVARAFDRIDRQGLAPLRIVEGVVGRRARSIGSGALPLLSRYASGGV